MANMANNLAPTALGATYFEEVENKSFCAQNGRHLRLAQALRTTLIIVGPKKVFNA
jgi:hypothetical protein